MKIQKFLLNTIALVSVAVAGAFGHRAGSRHVLYTQTPGRCHLAGLFTTPDGGTIYPNTLYTAINDGIDCTGPYNGFVTNSFVN